MLRWQKNLLVFLTFFIYTIFGSGNINAVRAATTLCYQQSANDSTIVSSLGNANGNCGLTFSGNYTFSGFWNGSLNTLIDGDWSTANYAFGNSTSPTTGIALMNYSKPLRGGVGDASFLQIKDGTSVNLFNASNDLTGCVEQVYLMLNVTSFSNGAANFVQESCWNGAVWKNLHKNSVISSSPLFFELGIYWNVTIISSTFNHTYQNTSLIDSVAGSYNLGNVSHEENFTLFNTSGASIDTVLFELGGPVSAANYTNKASLNGVKVYNKTSPDGIFYANWTSSMLPAGDYWLFSFANDTLGNSTSSNYTFTISKGSFSCCTNITAPQVVVWPTISTVKAWNNSGPSVFGGRDLLWQLSNDQNVVITTGPPFTDSATYGVGTVFYTFSLQSSTYQNYSVVSSVNTTNVQITSPFSGSGGGGGGGFTYTQNTIPLFGNVTSGVGDVIAKLLLSNQFGLPVPPFTVVLILVFFYGVYETVYKKRKLKVRL